MCFKMDVILMLKPLYQYLKQKKNVKECEKCEESKKHFLGFSEFLGLENFYTLETDFRVAPKSDVDLISRLGRVTDVPGSTRTDTTDEIDV